MRSSAVLFALCAACSFRHGATPAGDATGSGDGPPPMDAPADAAGCYAVELAASDSHTCARLNDGSVWCWGYDTRGQTGVDPASADTCNGGLSACTTSPNRVTMPTATALGLGDTNTCAMAGSDVYCWGANGVGEYGDGTVTETATPRLITARAGATTVQGGYNVLCSLAGGIVSCSGGNSFGDIGDGTQSEDTALYAALTGATALAKGYEDTCAIAGTTVECWGDNSYGIIDTTGITRTSPTTVAGVTNAIALAVGEHHACAIEPDHTLVCWGSDAHGELGDGQMTDSRAPGTAPISNVMQVVAMTSHTCALKNDGTVWCWGDNYTTSPAQIPLAKRATQVAAGSYHDCALLADGTVWCWGWDIYGQYGNGTTNDAIVNTPVKASLCM